MRARKNATSEVCANSPLAQKIRTAASFFITLLEYSSLSPNAATFITFYKSLRQRFTALFQPSKSRDLWEAGITGSKRRSARQKSEISLVLFQNPLARPAR